MQYLFVYLQILINNKIMETPKKCRFCDKREVRYSNKTGHYIHCLEKRREVKEYQTCDGWVDEKCNEMPY